MNALKQFLKWWNPAIATAAFAGGLYLRQWLLNIGIPNGLVLLLLFITIFLIMRLGQQFAESAVNSNAWLRKRILGNDFLEGDWMEACLDPVKKEFRAFTWMKLRYEDNSIRLSGEVLRCPRFTRHPYFSIFPVSQTQ